ncbi:hypothetical protein A374_01504 [Fictibacillus macauensis ZFHKF-1]|uniref:DUF6985 domain-containing protein n=1 Tax=Fictibacillus macauensis ZFHKF-1 TaxID=1196324 RepID=I8UK38_9BACL|nr:hypothetical protein A374_01504 [Fictibacillus macauensis ZFHKF-1]
MVKGEEDGKFDEEQYSAYKSLVKNWEQLLQGFLQAIVDYYKLERHELGYDIEVHENYPQIETTNQLELLIRMGILIKIEILG